MLMSNSPDTILLSCKLSHPDCNLIVPLCCPVTFSPNHNNLVFVVSAINLFCALTFNKNKPINVKNNSTLFILINLEFKIKHQGLTFCSIFIKYSNDFVIRVLCKNDFKVCGYS